MVKRLRGTRRSPKHASPRHTTLYDTYVCRVRPRVLGMPVLKHGTLLDGPEHGSSFITKFYLSYITTHYLNKINLK